MGEGHAGLCGYVVSSYVARLFNFQHGTDDFITFSALHNQSRCIVETLGGNAHIVMAAFDDLTF